MKKTLLIIGAGREQIPAYQIAKKMGLVDYRNEKIKPSLRGHRYLNDLLQIFMK